MDQIILPPVRLKETLGAKLRRSARDADRGNPTTNLPWKVPAAYAQGAAYTPGDVVSSSGGWYVATNTASSAGASGPSHTNAMAVWDGAGSTGVLWFYAGPAQMSADDPLAPAVEVNVNPTLGNLYRPTAFPDRFAVYGATPVVFATTRWQFNVFQTKAGTNAQGLASTVEFMIDEGAFEIELNAGIPGMAVIVDGRYLTLDGTGTPGTTSWMKVTIPGPRRPHRIEVRGHRSGWTFGGARVSTSGQVYAPPVDGSLRAVCFEDSIGAGSNYGPHIHGRQLHRQFGDHLGIKDVWAFAAGGRGYIAKGADGTLDTYAQGLAQAVALKPDIITFGGSTNDRGLITGTAFASVTPTAADITSAALATFSNLRSLGYAGPIVVFGLVSIDDSAVGANSKVAYVEQAVADAVTAFGDPNCWFIPVRNDPTGPWVTGAWNYGSQTTSTNSALFTNTDTNDKTHPSELGTAYYAARRAAAFRNSVLPNIL